MTDKPRFAAPTFIRFYPEHWGTLTRFTMFYSGTHKLSKQASKALRGASGHFDKALIFNGLVHRLRPNLALDEAHLKEHGFTGLQHAREFSAVVESVIVELYSAIDCCRIVVRDIYIKKTRGFPDSTRRTFAAINDGTLKGLPQELVDVFKAVDWYESFLFIRDELTHSDVGICRLHPTTDQVSYEHDGVEHMGEKLRIDDVFAWLDSSIANVNKFMGGIFQYLYSQLDQVHTDHLCCFIDGRAYMRSVAPVPDLSFHSGICLALNYDEPYKCKYADECGAYATAKQLATNPPAVE